MDDLFTPDAPAWQRLADRAATARTIGTAIGGIIPAALAVLACWLFLPWWAPIVAAVVALGWLVWGTIRAWRWTRAFRYAERERDLVLRTGLWNRQLSVIPYSRMQSVQVHSGPIDRLWGLAKVSLVTASMESRASVPGLTAEVATELRDRLIKAGETQALPL